MDRIAVIADIHANTYALNCFLEYIYKENIEIILNLGDFLQIGAEPKEVTDIVLTDRRFNNIIGNNEYNLFDISTEKFQREEKKHQLWTIGEIGKDRLELIKRIPEYKLLKINNNKILMIHSRKNRTKGMPLLYTETLNDFINDYDEFDADIILFGHTHEQLYLNHMNKIFINPGSLGCSKCSKASFAILEFKDNKLVDCNLKNISYDIDIFIKEYYDKDVPDKEFLLSTFYGL